jgi:RNA polymerase sigma factor (sigma-70 family)
MVKKAVETLEAVAAETLDPWWAQRRYDAPELSSEGFVSAAQRNLPALRLLLEGIETAGPQEPNAGSSSIRVQHFLREIFILLEETPLRFERFAPNCLRDIQEQTKRGEATFGMSLTQSSAYLTMVEGRGRELDGARELLTNPNLPIVIERAKAFSGRGIEFADLVGAGNIGLIDAANRFDWRRGNRFITPAVPWIDRCMRDEIYDKPNPCRPPRKQILAEPRRRNRLGELAHKLGRAPSQQEAESADIPTKPCHPAVRRLQDRSPSGGLIQNLLEDRSEPGDLSEEAAIAKKAISQLPTREQNIFYDRLEGKTLEEIGKALKITKERVRQIESRILKKLRKQLSHLQPFTR